MINKNLYIALCASGEIGINIIKEFNNGNKFFDFYRYLDYDEESTWFNFLTPSNYLIINQNAEQNNTVLTDYEYYTHRRRTNIRVGTFARRLFNNTYSDHEYEIFNLTLNKEYRFTKINFDAVEVLTGFDIRDAFHRNNSLQSGTLGKSCMRYAKAQPYLRLYTNNRNIVKLVVVKDNGLVAARTLLWNDKYHDRLYYATNNARSTLAAYLKAQNYFDAYENISCINLSIQLHRWDFKYYPYVDTFKFLMPNGELLNFVNDRRDVGEIKFLSQTDGGYFSRYICQNCHSLFGQSYYDRRQTNCPSCRV